MSSARTDSIGIYVAGACAVHCIATPLIVGILPVIGLPLLEPRTEWIFLSLSLTVSLFAVFSGCVRHRQWMPVAMFATGAGLLVAAHLVLADDGMAARGVILAGAALVIGAHLLNIRLCRCTPGTPECHP